MYLSLRLEPVTSCASYHVIRFTRLSPLFLHTASDQKLVSNGCSMHSHA